jgi:hypothetical protein
MTEERFAPGTDSFRVLPPEQANHADFWACRGCHRIGASYVHVIRQGCEGKPEPFKWIKPESSTSTHRDEQ